MKIAGISLATFGAFLEAAGTIIEKKVLRKHKINHKNYTVFEFTAIVLAAIPAFLVLSMLFPQIFSWKLAPEAFQLKNILIFSAIVIFSIFANLLVFYAMKWEKITELEPIRLSQPLFVILLAFVLYASERTTPENIIIVALIASLALIFSHIKKHHVQFSKYAVSALLGSLFFAIDLVLSKFLLPYYSPLSLYFIRSLFVLIICIPLLKPKFSAAKKQTWKFIFITGFIWVLYRSVLYYSYSLKGIIFTTLIFLLAPVFIYLFSYIYLKEKLSWRNIVASIIILLCVVYATLINGA